MKSPHQSNKSVLLKQALEREARAKGMSDPTKIASYVSARLGTLNQGIDVSPIEFEAPEDWRNHS